MDTRQIYITEFDLQRLHETIREQKHIKKEGREYIEALERELNRGKVVAPKDVSPTVVTMNSRICIEDLQTGEEVTFTLVFPEDANREQAKVSVLAPLGAAVLGYQVGDVFEWQVPDGVVQYRVKTLLYQPEASGNYDL